ncbi:MAG: hypothetical protein KQA34_03440 [Candidatus Aenigmarchaeota archaeon]|nr:hypothetical protein [Candidatus Aenigmarchaeota archaeon]
MEIITTYIPQSVNLEISVMVLSLIIATLLFFKLLSIRKKLKIRKIPELP